MTLLVCPVCDRVVEKGDSTPSDVQELKEHHEAAQHDGAATAMVFSGREVPPDGVNELYKRLESESREHKERFASRVMRDDRFRTSRNTDD